MDKNITLEQAMMLVKEIDQRMDALEARRKLEKPTSFDIPVTGWETDGTVPEFPMCCTVPVSAMLEADVVAVEVAPGGVAAARAASFATTESFDGGFRLRAKRVPKTPIPAQYRITNIKEE